MRKYQFLAGGAEFSIEKTASSFEHWLRILMLFFFFSFKTEQKLEL